MLIRIKVNFRCFVQKIIEKFDINDKIIYKKFTIYFPIVNNFHSKNSLLSKSALPHFLVCKAVLLYKFHQTFVCPFWTGFYKNCALLTNCSKYSKKY